jgi:hypothetical protein
MEPLFDSTSTTLGERYTLFPIKPSEQQLLKLYKQAVASFWPVEEVDLSKDRKDWESLSQNEQHFIKNILAFFSSSDTIVNINLGERFLNEVQILEAKSLGADIILLIASILSPEEIQNLAKFAKSLGMSVLLEVHNLDELTRSLCDDLDAVGVNNRNLGTFSVSIQHSYDLVEHIPSDFLKISESGISDPKKISGLKTVGFNGFLIGENFMKEDNPAQAMQDFVSQI